MANFDATTFNVTTFNAMPFNVTAFKTMPFDNNDDFDAMTRSMR
jgi:hypothetical protein